MSRPVPVLALGLPVGTVLAGLTAWLLLPCNSSEEPPWAHEVGLVDYQGLAVLGSGASQDDVQMWREVIDPYGMLKPYLEVTPNHMRIRVELEGPIVEIPLRAESLIPRPEPTATLTGLRVLLDPGHFGGAWSRVERRHFTRGGTEPIREGDLTYATARLLQERLEADGALVRLSRPTPPAEAFDPTSLGFDVQREATLKLGDTVQQHQVWRALYPARLSSLLFMRLKRQWIETEPVLLFKRYDLRRRAQMSEQWQPHVTLSLHYNMAVDPNRNGIIVFVPGSFLPDELDQGSGRYFAIRRLLENRMPATVAVASAISTQMQDYMELPALSNWPGTTRTLPVKLPVDADNGIFARNLAMLRRTSGVVLLLEGPCINNHDEYTRLVKRTVWVDGRHFTSRVEAYSEAVYQGLRQSAGWLRAAAAK